MSIAQTQIFLANI